MGELAYIKTFLEKVHTTHTVATIETLRNINFINDAQSILVFAGESLGSSGIIIKRQYNLQYRDATEGALNATIYALIEGVRKLNARETIAAYTKPAALVGMTFISSGKDFFKVKAGNWYTTIKITAEWLTA